MDEELADAGRVAARLGLAIAWTDGIVGEKCKRASDSGSGAWKHAKRLPDEEFAAGLFVRRCRTRNPVVVASASGLVLVEVDGPEELVERLGLELPPTVTVRSRRGLHRYYRVASGEPLKVQIAPDGITVSDDGYLVTVPALHETGWLYTINGGEVATIADELIGRLRALNDEARETLARGVAAGETIAEGRRREHIFHCSLRLAHDGLDGELILPSMLALNRERCRPPLEEAQVRAQVEGAVKHARKRPAANAELGALAEQLLAEYVAGEPPSVNGHEESSRPARAKRGLERRTLATVKPRTVGWLIEDVVPIGTHTLLAGVGGLGKSALALAWSARVTTAGGDVLLLSYEDATEEVVRPRMEALGGNLDRFHELTVDPLHGVVSLPTDLEEVARHVRETQARMLVIDPVSASIDVKLDAHRDQDVRVVLGQLARLAADESLAVVQVAHLNKAPGADPYLRINGSTAFYNAARSVLTVTRDPEAPDEHRLVAQHKSNYGRLADVERWRLRPVTLEQGIPTVVMEFVEIAEGVSREQVLATPVVTAEKRLDAEALIRLELADGPKPSRLVKLASTSEGISEATLKRAAQELGVLVEQRTTETGRATFWSLEGVGSPSLTTPLSRPPEPTPSERTVEPNAALLGRGRLTVAGERTDPIPHQLTLDKKEAPE